MDKIWTCAERFDCTADGGQVTADLSRSRIMAVLNEGNDLQKKVNKRVFDKMLNGGTLNPKKADEYEAEGDIKLEQLFRMSYFMTLIKIYFLGGGDKISLEDVKANIQKNQERLAFIIYK